MIYGFHEQTQKEKVISYITQHGVITTKQASDELWILDLQSVIRNLKQDGYTIYSDYKKSKKSRYKAYAFKKKDLDKFLMEIV